MHLEGESSSLRVEQASTRLKHRAVSAIRAAYGDRIKLVVISSPNEGEKIKRR